MPQITTDSFRQQLCAVFTEYPWLAIQQSLQEEVRKGWRELNSNWSQQTPATSTDQAYSEWLASWDQGNALTSGCTMTMGIGTYSSHTTSLTLKFQITAPFSPRKTGSHREEENGSNRCTTVWLNLTYCKFGLLLKNQQTLVTLLCSDLVGPSQASPWS